jgi:hypothetical protein
MAMLCFRLPNFHAAEKGAERGENFEEVMTIDGGEAAIRMVIASVLAEHGEIGGRAFEALAAMRQAEAIVRALHLAGYEIRRKAYGQALACVYNRENEAIARQAKVLTAGEARRLRRTEMNHSLRSRSWAP